MFKLTDRNEIKGKIASVVKGQATGRVRPRALST